MSSRVIGVDSAQPKRENSRPPQIPSYGGPPWLRSSAG